MSLLKRVNDIDLYVVPNQQWVVCAMYPYYKSLEKFFDFTNEDYKDISKGSCTVNGIQKPLVDEEWDKERTEYKEWLLDTFSQVQVPIKEINEDWEGGEQYKAWTINYFGGWQAGHFQHSVLINKIKDLLQCNVLIQLNHKKNPQRVFIHKPTGCKWIYLRFKFVRAWKGCSI